MAFAPATVAALVVVTGAKPASEPVTLTVTGRPTTVPSGRVRRAGRTRDGRAVDEPLVGEAGAGGPAGGVGGQRARDGRWAAADGRDRGRGDRRGADDDARLAVEAGAAERGGARDAHAAYFRWSRRSPMTGMSTVEVAPRAVDGHGPGQRVAVQHGVGGQGAEDGVVEHVGRVDRDTMLPVCATLPVLRLDRVYVAGSPAFVGAAGPARLRLNFAGQAGLPLVNHQVWKNAVRSRPEMLSARSRTPPCVGR